MGGKLRPRLPDGATCERCARCLSVCPSYLGALQETMSPRGRWELVRAMAAGELLPGSRGREAFSRCLQCRACVEACPKGVDVPAAVLVARQALAGGRGLKSRLERRLLALGLRHRRQVARLARLLTPLRVFLPRRPQGGRHLPLFLPEILAGRRVPPIAAAGVAELLPETVAPESGAMRGEVLLFTGCYFGLLDPAPVQAAVRVLTAAGFTVHLPKGQGCCGAPAWYAGHADLAREAFWRTMQSLVERPELPILTLCATCGSTLRNLGQCYFAGRPLEAQAAQLGARVRDCCDFLAQQEESALPLSAVQPAQRVTVHDPCHLQRGLQVRDALRTLLARVPGLELVEADARNSCCGGGGLSGFKHPLQASQVGQLRVRALQDTGAGTVVSPCPGCLLQLRDQLERGNSPMRALHPLELLAACLD